MLDSRSTATAEPLAAAMAARREPVRDAPQRGGQPVLVAAVLRHAVQALPADALQAALQQAGLAALLQPGVEAVPVAVLQHAVKALTADALQDVLQRAVLADAPQPAALAAVLPAAAPDVAEMQRLDARRDRPPRSRRSCLSVPDRWGAPQRAGNRP